MPPIGGRCPPFDRHNVDAAGSWVEVKEDPPITDPATEGGSFVAKWDDVTGTWVLG